MITRLVAMSVILVLLVVVMRVVPAGVYRLWFSPAELSQGDEGALRQIVGEVRYAPPTQPDQRVHVEFNVTEEDWASLAGGGYVNWRVTTPEAQAGADAMRIDSEVRCVLFGADQRDSDPATAVVVSQITYKEGNGQGQQGEYAMFWVRDDYDKDSVAIVPYRLEPLTEFFPAYEPAPCNLYVDAQDVGTDAEVVAEFSNMSIRR